MRRRDLITLLGGAAPAAWCYPARAQQPAMPVIGLLGAGSAQSDALRGGCSSAGPDGSGLRRGTERRIRIPRGGGSLRAIAGACSRWCHNSSNRRPNELVRREVTVIISIGGITSASAAKSATTTIPIVFEIGGDPIKLGLVASLNRPGSNITGVTFLVGTLTAKQFEVLHETVPKAALIGFLVNQTIADAETQTKNALAAAESVGAGPAGHESRTGRQSQGRQAARSDNPAPDSQPRRRSDRVKRR